MAYITCAKCGSSNVLAVENDHCYRCGEALPSLIGTSSKTEDDPPPLIRRSRSVFQDEERDAEERQQRRRRRRRRRSNEWSRAGQQAVVLLFSIAGLQMICGMIVLAAAEQIPQFQGVDKSLLAVIFFVTILIFAGLGTWAIFSPLVPTLLGLIIYLCLTVIDVIGNPEIVVSIGFWLRVGILVALIQTVGLLTKVQPPTCRDNEDDD